jgi:hypothetical protein
MQPVFPGRDRAVVGMQGSNGILAYLTDRKWPRYLESRQHKNTVSTVGWNFGYGLIAANLLTGKGPTPGAYCANEQWHPIDGSFHLPEVWLGLQSYARAVPRKEGRPLRLYRLQERGSLVVRYL